jgi:hypothetical protein
VSRALAEAARARSEASFASVRSAVRRMRAEGKRISVNSVSIEASVSRNFIYTSPLARELVLAARSDGANQPARTLRSSMSSGSEGSLRTRLTLALTEIRELQRQLEKERDQNSALIAEIMELQNPTAPANVMPLRKRRF